MKEVMLFSIFFLQNSKFTGAKGVRCNALLDTPLQCHGYSCKHLCVHDSLAVSEDT